MNNQNILQSILNSIQGNNSHNQKFFSNMNKKRVRNNTNVKMPKGKPDTQSCFYMPLISEAYLMAVESKDREKTFKFKLTETNIPQWITKSIMTSRKGLFIPVQLYNKMVQVLSYSFKKQNKLQEIQGYYNASGESKLTFTTCGHIKGDKQVELIGQANYRIILIILETFIHMHYLLKDMDPNEKVVYTLNIINDMISKKSRNVGRNNINNGIAASLLNYSKNNYDLENAIVKSLLNYSKKNSDLETAIHASVQNQSRENLSNENVRLQNLILQSVQSFQNQSQENLDLAKAMKASLSNQPKSNQPNNNLQAAINLSLGNQSRGNAKPANAIRNKLKQRVQADCVSNNRIFNDKIFNQTFSVFKDEMEDSLLVQTIAGRMPARRNVLKERVQAECVSNKRVFNDAKFSQSFTVLNDLMKDDTLLV